MAPQPDQDFRRTNVFFVAFLVLGLAFVLSHKYNDTSVNISTALMWVMACLASGAAVGFLFGIPKIYQGNKTVLDLTGGASSPPGQQPATPAGQPPAGAGAEKTTTAPPQPQGEATNYRQEVNTNLTEISDWLTKIIVGLGLINLGQIPTYLDRMASSLAGGLSPAAAQAQKGFAFGLITCFSVFGFLSGYIYTRVFLSVLFSRSDRQAISDASQQAQQATRAAESAVVKAESALQAAALGVGKSADPRGAEDASAEASGGKLGDPWKRQFGGESERGNRKLDAEVTWALRSANLFSVRLRVYSTKPAEDPLRGTVQFFLHPTFKNDRPVVKVGADGVAELLLTAWGAFTVGALADKGETRLELDLAELEGAPQEFRSR
jgi:hypothetical protein